MAEEVAEVAEVAGAVEVAAAVAPTKNSAKTGWSPCRYPTLEFDAGAYSEDRSVVKVRVNPAIDIAAVG